MASPLLTYEDLYLREDGSVFISGIQTLVRLLILQKKRDLALGLKTAGFISGYRGSPLGGFDQALWKAKSVLESHEIHFQPAVNEDLGATAVWGSQQLHLSPGAQYQGVFGLWYGKGPGVDRSGDVLKHANAAGTSTFGGVLALAGDDHACKSSSLPHQSDFAFIDASIPLFVPSTLDEILKFGLYGWAMSRYSGCWVGMKLITDTVDTSSIISLSTSHLDIKTPQDFFLPPEGLNLRWPDKGLLQEKRLQHFRLKAAQAFVRSNALDQVIYSPQRKKIGLITYGKSYLDTCQALEDLGVDKETYGIGLYKPAMIWPLEPERLKDFAKDFEEIFVIEEKRSLVETQIKEILYHLPSSLRPRVVGKTDEKGAPLLPDIFELNTLDIARALSQRLGLTHSFIDNQNQHLKSISDSPLQRIPYYCPGCPHNRSTTQLPSGSRALAGIGCHYMATWITPKTETFAHMGGEGVPWIGQAPFTKESHIFANMGDGTYFHSGSLALRAAVAAGVSITYKILYNDAVAMTGGQPVDGPLTVPMITHQVAAEGIKKIVVVTDDPYKYSPSDPFASHVSIHPREDLESVQEDLKKWEGVSVLIYDQTCAAEKRRRRKRKLMIDPPKRAFINESVCEGCGDCSKKSNCLSVIPIETEWGRKRAIDQSNCNKDFSCIEGFCPSFITIDGASLRKNSSSLPPLPSLPDPTLPSLHEPYNILLTGMGGTGVVTLGQIFGLAAYREKKGCTVIDMAGLAQKGGAVYSHIRFATSPDHIKGTRLSKADLVLGCDFVVAASPETLKIASKERTIFIVNDDQPITGSFTHNPDYEFKHDSLKRAILRESNEVLFIKATERVKDLFGDTILSNVFLLGYAYQKGFIPLGGSSLEEAIRSLNISVNENLSAFRWGRVAAHEGLPEKNQKTIDLETLIQQRYDFLKKYQNQGYGDRFLRLVKRVQEKNDESLTRVVAENFSKLMAYKDEYEVARLYTDPAFLEKLRHTFEGKLKITFHLAPPFLAKKSLSTGHLEKRAFGPWILSLFKIMRHLKVLRGTPFDPFGYTKERQEERHLINEYEEDILLLLEKFSPQYKDSIIERALLPQKIRGFGHIKQASIKDASQKRKDILQEIL